jgi:magnesium transporter
MTALKKSRRRRRRVRGRTEPGTVPGFLPVDPDAPRSRIRVIAYGSDRIVEKDIAEPEEISQYLGRWPVVWVQVTGLGDAELLRRIGTFFNLHRLALEDVVNVHQRPKLESYHQIQYVVVSAAMLDGEMITEQVSFFLGKGFVLSFEETPGGLLDPIRNRIRGSVGVIRGYGADYLLYALLDTIVDHLFPLLELYGERLEDLEDQAIFQPGKETLSAIHAIRRDLLTLRRMVWPQRDLFNVLLRDPIPSIGDETRLHLRDCYDHITRAIDFMETYREEASYLMEIYLSGLSNRMNQVMKVLTMIATIFIPLSFVTGLYGMNFNPEVSPWNMPELNWYFGYPLVLGLMFLTAAGLLWFFRRKGWIESLRLKSREADGEKGASAPE